MRKPNRVGLSIAAGVTALGLVIGGATLATTDASSGSPKAAPIDANTLNGYKAKELVKTYYNRNENALNDFNNCNFRTRLIQTVRAPVAGYVQVTGGVGAARDTDFPDPAELVMRLVVGTQAISAERATQLTTDGSYDGNVSVEGFKRVTKGKTKIKLQLAECGDGDAAAFVTDRTISTLFVPFGTSKVAGAGPIKAKVNR